MAGDYITAFHQDASGSWRWWVGRRQELQVVDQGDWDGQGEVWPSSKRKRYGARVVLSVPADRLVVRVMDLPVVEPAELDSMVQLQVDKFSPFPVEQMVSSYELISQDENTSRVLMAAARLDAIKGPGDRLKAAGCRIVRVDCVALGLWYVLKEKGLVASSGRETLVCVTAESLVVLTHESGKLEAMSGLALPESWDEEADDLAEEISRLMLELDAERGVTGVRVLTLMTSAGEPPPGFAEALAAHADLTPSVKVLDRDIEPLAGVVARSQFDQGSRALDLMPSMWRLADDERRLRSKMILAGSVMMGVWVLLALGSLGWIQWQGIRFANLEAENQRWAEPANQVRRLRLQVNMIERYRDRSRSALESLREISLLQPQGVDLTSFTYRKDEGIEIVGEADTGPLVLRFNENLNNSALLGEVRAGTRTQTRQGRHRFSFDIRFAEETP